MGELSKKVGKRIKQIRESQNIKQCILAEKLNMEPSNLTRIESGYQLPKEENMQKIAAILNVDVKDLFDFHDEYSKEILRDKIINIIEDSSLNEVRFLYDFMKLYMLSK